MHPILFILLVFLKLLLLSIPCFAPKLGVRSGGAPPPFKGKVALHLRVLRRREVLKKKNAWSNPCFIFYCVHGSFSHASHPYIYIGGWKKHCTAFFVQKNRKKHCNPPRGGRGWVNRMLLSITVGCEACASPPYIYIYIWVRRGGMLRNPPPPRR